jgi:predicted nucleic acid-binding protein
MSDAALVDTNVLLDIATSDPVWFEWSRGMLAKLSDAGSLIIDDVVYAELSPRFATRGSLDVFVTRAGLDRRRTPADGLFRAGRAYLAYRTRGGSRTNVLPDFFVGAHAAVTGLPLLTRDVARYRTYFPQVTLIAP